jgi:hypothetical protein
VNAHPRVEAAWRVPPAGNAGKRASSPGGRRSLCEGSPPRNEPGPGGGDFGARIDLRDTIRFTLDGSPWPREGEGLAWALNARAMFGVLIQGAGPASPDRQRPPSEAFHALERRGHRMGRRCPWAGRKAIPPSQGGAIGLESQENILRGIILCVISPRDFG